MKRREFVTRIGGADLLGCAAVPTQHQIFLSEPNFRISTEKSAIPIRQITTKTRRSP